jgi:hypothetical protein
MNERELDDLVARLQRHRPEYSAAPTDADELVMRSAEIIATARAEVDALRELLLRGLAHMKPLPSDLHKDILDAVTPLVNREGK